MSIQEYRYTLLEKLLSFSSFYTLYSFRRIWLFIPKYLSIIGFFKGETILKKVLIFFVLYIFLIF